MIFAFISHEKGYFSNPKSRIKFKKKKITIENLIWRRVWPDSKRSKENPINWLKRLWDLRFKYILEEVTGSRWLRFAFTLIFLLLWSWNVNQSWGKLRRVERTIIYGKENLGFFCCFDGWMDENEESIYRGKPKDLGIGIAYTRLTQILQLAIF